MLKNLIDDHMIGNDEMLDEQNGQQVQQSVLKLIIHVPNATTHCIHCIRNGDFNDSLRLHYVIHINIFDDINGRFYHKFSTTNQNYHLLNQNRVDAVDQIDSCMKFNEIPNSITCYYNYYVKRDHSEQGKCSIDNVIGEFFDQLIHMIALTSNEIMMLQCILLHDNTVTNITNTNTTNITSNNNSNDNSSSLSFNELIDIDLTIQLNEICTENRSQIIKYIVNIVSKKSQLTKYMNNDQYQYHYLIDDLKNCLNTDSIRIIMNKPQQYHNHQLSKKFLKRNASTNTTIFRRKQNENENNLKKMPKPQQSKKPSSNEYDGSFATYSHNNIKIKINNNSNNNNNNNTTVQCQQYTRNESMQQKKCCKSLKTSIECTNRLPINSNAASAATTSVDVSSIANYSHSTHLLKRFFRYLLIVNCFVCFVNGDLMTRNIGSGYTNNIHNQSAIGGIHNQTTHQTNKLITTSSSPIILSSIISNNRNQFANTSLKTPNHHQQHQHQRQQQIQDKIQNQSNLHDMRKTHENDESRKQHFHQHRDLVPSAYVSDEPIDPYKTANRNDDSNEEFSRCPSCQFREQLKAHNLASIKMHILTRLSMTQPPNITGRPHISEQILQSFYQNNDFRYIRIRNNSNYDDEYDKNDENRTNMNDMQGDDPMATINGYSETEHEHQHHHMHDYHRNNMKTGFHDIQHQPHHHHHNNFHHNRHSNYNNLVKMQFLNEF